MSETWGAGRAGRDGSGGDEERRARPATVPGQDPGPGGGGAPGPGRLLGDRYRLVERLGQGGMGTVWKAHDEVIARDVAVKEPRLPEGVPDEFRDTVFARLEREARAAARIEHPSVVGIHDVVSVDGRPWIVMELIHGRSLADVLAEGVLTPPEAARIALPVVRALAAAHARDILHRDVKPANIMLGPAGRVVLTDFGIARIEGEAALTQSNAFVGSPEYTAPERVRGRVPGPASDFFSVGALLYRAVQGVAPFHRDVQQAAWHAVLFDDPPAPSRAGALGPLITELLRKEPDERPSSGEIVSVLEGVAAPATTSVATRSGDAETGGSAVVGRHGRRNVVLAALTSAVVAGGVVTAVLGPGGSGPPSDWESHDYLGASLSLPAKYEYEQDIPPDLQQSLKGEATAYRVESGKYHQEFLLFRGDTDGAPQDVSPTRRAQWWFDKYTSEYENSQVTVTDREVNGRDCKVLTYTRRPDGEGTALRRKKELYYPESGGHVWKIALDWETLNGEADAGGDRLFEQVVDTFEPPE
ncbi:serine/threonine-protein kinase [Streptomyces sp. HNM0574]|uniref:serine/threonine-protein kinase n=1 Tax=Streptomyces sp. HNM0574 TaxID=2714954 RepID=UPI00146D51F0|nr:serine/threonine-protein kinase [Streptomyces sp. HNM0574]NLU70846.1 serine/threonine protein kinase [Streptomyces sp. HNM0574]